MEAFQNRLKSNPLIGSSVSVVDIKTFLEKRNLAVLKPNISAEDLKDILASVENNDNRFFKFFSDFYILKK